jgi:hypothetical protein
MFAYVFIFHSSQQSTIFEKYIAAEFTNMNLLQRASQTRMRTVDYNYRAADLKEI